MNRAGVPMDPLIIDEDALTCDAYTMTGCPNGYQCKFNSYDTVNLGVGFCCPDVGKEGIAEILVIKTR